MRTVHTWFLPQLIRPELVQGHVAVILDQLRATSTITHALANGAAAVLPYIEVDDARAARAQLPASLHILTGGERNGIRIEGFDLDNSPAAYTRERADGATLIFTTTNGAAAIHAAARAGARRILIGSLANLSGIIRTLQADAELHPDAHTHLVCAGTRAEISQDDCLAAGAIVARLRDHGWTYPTDDSSRIAESLWINAHAEPSGILHVLQQSRGGRNLHKINLDADIHWCANVDTHADAVGEYHAATNRITRI